MQAPVRDDKDRVFNLKGKDCVINRGIDEKMIVSVDVLRNSV
jgi:hypothetical protein